MRERTCKNVFYPIVQYLIPPKLAEPTHKETAGENP
jgi:hypothetical protein